MSFRKEFGGDYKGFRIYNYHFDCLLKEADVKIYQHSDADRHWYIFVNKTTTKK